MVGSPHQRLQLLVCKLHLGTVTMAHLTVAGFRLSPLQSTQWHRHPTPLAPALVQIERGLNRTRLRSVIREVIERNENLRTVFHPTGSQGRCQASEVEVNDGNYLSLPLAQEGV
jgi:hypothetical protein